MRHQAMKFGGRNRGVVQRAETRGFTLIELMIAVAVVAILSMIALPSYRAYVLRANRAQAKVDLMQTAQEMERIYTMTRDYTQAAAYCGRTLPSPPTGGAVYNITPVCNADKKSYLITATPLGQQLAHDPCGALDINQAGVKRYHGSNGTNQQCAW